MADRDRKDAGGGRTIGGYGKLTTFCPQRTKLPVMEDSRGRSGIGRGGRPPGGGPGDPGGTRAAGGNHRGKQPVPAAPPTTPSDPTKAGGGQLNGAAAASTQTPRPTRLSLGVGATTKEGGRKGSALPRLSTANTTLTTSIPGRKPSGLRQPGSMAAGAGSGAQGSGEGQRRATGGASGGGSNSTSSNIPRTTGPKLSQDPSSGGCGVKTNSTASRLVPPTDSSVNPENKPGSRLVSSGCGGNDGKAILRPSALPVDVAGSRGNASSLSSVSGTKPEPPGGAPGPSTTTSGLQPPRGRSRIATVVSSASNIPSRSGSRIPNPGGAAGGSGGVGGMGSGMPNRRRPRLGSSGSSQATEHNRTRAPQGRASSSKSSSKPSSPSSETDVKSPTCVEKGQRREQNVNVNVNASNKPSSPLSPRDTCPSSASNTQVPPRPPRLIPRRIPSNVSYSSSQTGDKNSGSNDARSNSDTKKPPLAPRTTSLRPPQNVSPTRKRFSTNLSLSSSSSYSIRTMGGRVSSEDEGSQCTSPDAGLSSSTSVCGSELSDTSAPYSDVSIPSPVKLRGHMLLDWDTDSYASTSVGASPDRFLDDYQYESDWKTDSFISQHADSGWYTDSCFSPNSPKDTFLPELLTGGYGSPHQEQLMHGESSEGHQNLFLRLNSNGSADSKRSSRVSVDSFMLPPSPSEDENGVLRIDSEHLAMIYTDWANHYLEKARNKRVITDLQVDICDGVILAEVIEAVTNERVRDIKTKPRNSQQMVENISQCLTFLAGLGVNVEGLSAKDIKDGNLKAILGLFFSLSRFKQQQKSAQQQVQHNINQNTVTPTSDSGRSSTGSASNANANTEMLSRLPSPFSSKGNSKCPTVTHPGVTKDAAPSNHNLNKNRTPAAAAAVAADRLRSPAPQNNNNPPASHRSQELKSRPLLSKGGSSSIPSKATSRESVSTSRSTSPSSSVSNIPTPGGRSGLRAPGTISEKHAAAASGRLVSSTSTSSCASTASGASSSTKSSGTNPAAASKAGLGAGANNKNSMLDKFKFFKGDKKSGVPKSSSSKKGSSSSADKDAEKSQQQTGASAQAEAKGGVGTSSRIASPKTEPNGASGGGGSPKLPVKSSTKKSSFGLKKKDTSVSKDDLNSKRGIPTSASANLQPGALTVNGTGSSSGAKRSSGSSKAEKAEAATAKGSSSSSSNTNQNGGQSGQSSPQSSRKTSKIASLAGKSSSKSSKNAASNSNLSGAAAPAGSGIPAPSTGIPKPGSRSSSKPPKEDSKAKVPTSSSSSKEKGFQHSGPPPAVAQHAQLKSAARSESSRTESPKPPPRTTSVLSSTLEQQQQQQEQQQQQQHANSSSQMEMERSDASLRRAAKNSNQVQLDELARVQKHVKAAAMAAARSQSPSGDMTTPTRSSSSSSTTHSSQRTPSASSASAAAEHHEARKASSGAGGSRPKPVKVDSDTQTHASAVAVAHARMREVGKEKSSQSLSSEGSGSANVSSGENSKSSTSNSNNSVSSNDSVIFRPSSCDELESGMESDGGGSLSAKPTDHISNLRKHNGANTMNSSNCSSPGSPAGVRRGDIRDTAATKMETTFDTEGHAETRDVEHKPSRETTFGDEQEDIIDIKPMMPITRSSPYAYLKSMAPGTLPRPSFHMSTQLTPGANSASSRLGVNRPLIDPHSYSQLKRTVSNGHHNMDTELSAHNLDGYMSDGDVLHSTIHHPNEENSGYFSDVNSGYMSEGGATLYAKKMQQRFREGMAAVKECMQKSAGLPDEDRYVRHGLQYPIEHSGFDDSSSISSGEISDTINEISTDENLTGSSLSAGSEHTNNPYGGSLRRAPQSHNPFSHQNKFGLLKSGNGLLDRNLHLGGSTRETGDFSLRKYFIGGDRLPSDARSDGSLERSHWGMDRNSGPHPIYRTIDIPPSGSLLRKGSQGTVTDPRTGQQWQPGTAYAVEDPSLKNTYAEHSGGSGGSGKSEKKDSETNTDHTLMLRKGQAGRPPQGGFALRRPLSNVSTGSTGSSKSGSSIHGPQIGMKLTEKEKAQQKGERLANYTGAIRPVQKTASGTQTGYHHTSRSESSTDMGPEAYSESTLERKKRSASLVTSKSQSTVSVNAGQAPAPGGPDDYRSSTLGRKRPDMAIRDRLFGSRSSLNGKPPVPPEGGQNTVNGTIISNPHATYSKQESSPYRHNTYSGSMSTSSTSPVSASPYVNVNYAQSDMNRPSSAMSNPTSPSNSPWIKSAPASLHNGAMRGTLSETESMESISSSASSSIQAQIQQARAHGLLSRSILQHEKDIQTGNIQRSDSFRSTQSEKMFPSASQPDGLQRTNSFSQITGHPPPSPTPSNSSHASSRYTYPGMTPMSPTSGGMSLIHATSTNSQSVPYGLGLPLSKINSKDEDLHGSALSLVSSSSSVYSTADERAAAEILKLRRELESAQEKVSALTSQLAPNIHIPGHHQHGQQQNALTAYSLSQRAHVVAAFEQSLSNMTTRLQQLTSTAEQKDSELNDLRATIETLKQQSGIQFSPEHTQFSPGSHRRPSSSNTSTLSREPSTPGEPPRISRHMSSDSMSSINSLSSACSATSQQSSATDTDSAKKKKKGKSWLRSSFSKAFSRKKNKHGSVSDVEPDTASMRSDCSVPNSPLLHPHSTSGSSQNNSSMKGSHSSHALCDVDQDKAVMQLQVALHEKDMKLTDIRLEALSSAHQLEQLRETMNRMKNEMASLKADNSRLQQLVCKKGLNHPQPMAANPTSPTALEKRLSLEAPSNLDILLSDNADREGRRITISVSMTNEVSKLAEGRPGEVLVGAISVSGKTKWEMLDVIVRRVFKEYVLRIDPVTNLGLTTESVNYYGIGDLIRAKDVSLPELLPCGYLVGDHTNITLTLKGTSEHSVESLAFETLIPKSIVQRYISLLLEHRRIILCGPSGTGKSYLAQKLAEYLVLKAGKELTAGLIATFNVDHKSSKELRQYLANIADQCESTTAGELPSVIILDNLHHVTSLGEVFNGFLSVKYQKCPYIIGTMNQATCSTTNLQLHHNFRWVLCANHMEPVKGFLGRYLRRKLIEAEIQTRARNNDLAKIVDWMPKVWQHLNKFLETHSSSDVTIGPRLFLSCPMDVPGSQVWFTDLWNYSIVPYLLEAVREGLQVYGRRAPWEDPADWVIETYPWPHSNDQDWPSLLRLRPEDVGYDTQGPPTKSEKAQGQGAQQSDSEGDPLLNMLMRLQEAASYSSPQSADSDSTSLDSHSSGVQEFTSSNSTESTL